MNGVSPKAEADRKANRSTNDGDKSGFYISSVPFLEIKKNLTDMVDL